MQRDGEPIADSLAGGALALERALEIGAQLAAALAERHRRGRPHLALRPQVVLWCASERRVRLLENVAPAPPDFLYVAPEQTGRTELQPDARSDLYVLGLLLYELLTGASPLSAADPLARIHWHLAVPPEAPAQRRPGLPGIVSDLVLRLLAKAPDERYQTAAGVRHDLAACLRAWSEHAAIEPFVLGARDHGPALAVPDRLYGREHERHLLLQAFEQVCAGGRALLLVEGWSGIGKTSLIQQLVRPIVQQRGWFIAGKFDQVVRGVPFGGLIQALRSLVRQLLAGSEIQLAAAREALLRSLGENGGVLAEVIPEIELIVGPQPAPLPLRGIEAQNRFQRVLQQFVEVLAQPGRPLVLFLDDLQWADAATLSLLEPLLADAAIGGLLLLGAYRDNELDASPRLAHTLATLANAGVAMQRIALGPLALPDVVALVADTLHLGSAQAEPLARLVHHKTGGNPFFAIRFLHLLVQEGPLRFDEERGAWRYELEAIARAPLADNVVELMTRSIRRLAPRAQATLTLAACIGNGFDAATLARVGEQPLAPVEQDLRAAAAAGLIVPDDGDAGAGRHAFLHDRVQQAAYALIPAPRRALLHLTIGRLLRARVADDARLFDVVHHLNLGRHLIEARAERREVAALNLAAGRRAKASAAHESALEMLRCGQELLDDAAWHEDYALAFALHLEAADSLMLCGLLDAAHAALVALLPHSRDAIDRGQVVRLRSLAFEAGARYAEALASTREGLEPFGAAWPGTAAGQQAALDGEIAAIEALRAGRPIAALAGLATMQDASVRLVMAMLTDIWSATYLVGQATLARLISALLVRLSLQHGNVEESAYGYVTHAISVGAVSRQYRDAFEYGRLALAVNARFDDRRRRAKIYQQFHAHVNFWCAPLRECIPYAREACRAGLDSGDFLYAAYAAGTEPWAAVLATQDLAQFVREHEPAVALIERLKSRGFADSVRMLLAWARALQGATDGPLSLTHAGFDEAAWLQAYRDNGFFAGIHAVARLQLAVLFGAPHEALQAARHSAALIGHLPGTVWPLAHEFWHALALARAGDAAALPELAAARQAFAARAEHCAENFRGQALLLAAETARLEGRTAQAAEHLAEAIEFAAAHPLVALEALAHERCAALQRDAGRARLAALHDAAARAAYRRWGAGAKLAADGAVPPAVAAALPASRPADAGDGLDLLSVLQAAQAIAAETDVAALLARLMQIALQNAGAECGALVLETAEGPLVHAFDPASPEVPAALGVPLADAGGVPAGIVNFVRRTGETVALADAGADELHGRDPHVLAQHSRSLLCLPVQQHGRLLGVLVLENRRVAGAFSAARRRTMAVLGTQAAISLENARLLAAVEAENSALRRDLIANVSHDLRTPLVSLRGYLELLAAKGDDLPAAQRAQYLGIAVRQSERLGTLIDELFELAKLDFKGMTLQRERFALAELAADVVQKFRLEAQGRQVALQLHTPARLGFVEADLGLIERVFENLVGNALRHTPAGGTVELRVVEGGAGLLVEVADSGRGIAAADLPFIFDRHWRGGNGPRGEGAGLGLAITRRILELHGSTIRAESDGCSGSCFGFRLPLA